MPFNENNRKELEIQEENKEYTYNITNILVTNCHILLKRIQNQSLYNGV